MKGADYGRVLALKAEHDLKAAEIGLEHQAPLDTVCFHLQQIVEKLLKSVLACREREYPLTHDLDELLNLAAKECQELAGFRGLLSGFETYALAMRYDESLEPSREEVTAALELARKIRKTVHLWLPREAQP
jgi:HEPN domain-containing protein